MYRRINAGRVAWRGTEAVRARIRCQVPPKHLRLLTQPGDRVGDCASPPLMPPWDLEAWADYILGLPRRGTIHSRRVMYTAQELRQKARLDIPFGDDMDRFGYREEGRLILGTPGSYDEDLARDMRS